MLSVHNNSLCYGSWPAKQDVIWFDISETNCLKQSKDNAAFMITSELYYAIETVNELHDIEVQKVDIFTVFKS